MIAAASLGNIVEQRGNVQQPVPVEIGHELARQGVFLRMFRHREAAQITYHHQDVLIHGVGMEQVVLHLPHNTPEYGEVARSEEHTSELRSLMRISYAVFCLKKKKTT